MHPFMMPFFVLYFFLHYPTHHMKATSCSGQTWDIFKFWICANYIYTISISFSLLYNLSSFYQCLHFVLHLVMYKLLTKILLYPSFCLKSSIPYKSEVYFKYISKVYLNYTPSILEVTWNILQVYFKYTLTCWITEKDVYFKSILFRQKKYIWNTFCELQSVFLSVISSCTF